MKERNLPFGKPMVGPDEIGAVEKVLAQPKLVHGQRTAEFEVAFARFVGTTQAVAVSSCTAGLHLSLWASGIERGHEVVVPAMTHVATAHAVELCGAKPLFADVDPVTGNITAETVEAAVTTATSAILPVHYLGLACEMETIGKTAAAHGCTIIEDCALAVGAEFDKRKTGNLGTAGCFSFYPVKHMTTIEGGMITLNDDGLADSIRRKRAFGYDNQPSKRRQPGIYDIVDLGMNYRMNEVEAAIGLVQLERVESFIQARKRNYYGLRKRLEGIEGIRLLADQSGLSTSSYYCMNVVLTAGISRQVVTEELARRGIGYSIHYPKAVPLTSYYREKYGYEKGDFPVSEELAERSISLPVGPHLDEDDMRYLGDNVEGALIAART